MNFSDDNRALHLQAFFKWLPEEFHDTPHIDWTQLPSKVIGYLVNTVGDSPFAVSLAIAAFSGLEPMKKLGVQRRISELNGLLKDVQIRCGVHSAAKLTTNVWETYLTEKELTPKDYVYFKTYATFTESHIPNCLEKLNPLQYARIEAYVLPRLPRKFRQQHLPVAVLHEGEKQRRKGKSDILAPLHTLLVALVRYRKQNTQQLLLAYHEALVQAQTPGGELPLLFSYEDELVMVNREAQTVADIRLEKRSVTLRFRLWDQQSWVKAHPKKYHKSTRGSANVRRRGFTKQRFFVECLNPAEELLWFPHSAVSTGRKIPFFIDRSQQR